MVSQPVNIFDQQKSPSKIIMILAWPTVIEQILQTMVNYVDTAMVGTLGAQATAAIAINSSLIWLINGLMNAAALGFSVQVAREIGVGNNDEAKKIIRQAIGVMLCIGLGVTLIIEILAGRVPIWLGAEIAIVPNATKYLRIIASAYLMNAAVIFCGAILRGAGDTRTPLFYNLLANAINIIGNIFLIFPTRQVALGGYSFTMWGADLGVAGAAIATAFSGLIAGCFMLSSIFYKKSAIQINLKGDYTPNTAILSLAWRMGSPAAYERLVMSSGQLLLTKMVAGLGTSALAAYYLSNTAEAISYLPGFGFSVAATTLVAQSLGAGDKDLASSYSRLCVRYGVILMGLAGVLMFFFSRQLISLFTPDQEVIALGSIGIKIMALSEPFFALSIVITGILRGAGDSKWPFYITAIGMWGVRLIAVYALCYPLGLGIYGAWIAMVLDLAVRGLLSLWRLRSKVWLDAW